MQIKNIICIGEILWDSMPKGLFLGGAPFNVAVHLKNLGNRVSIVSKVGNDELGQEILRRVSRNKINSETLQRDEEHASGFVRVDLDENDNPKYDIVGDVAWDYIESTDFLQSADSETLVVFGSLAQRNTVSRKTIQSLIQTDAYTVFDINLRPPFDSKEIVEASLYHTNLVKFNDIELKRLCSWFNLADDPEKAAAEISKKFGCEIVCITKGSNGAALWNDHQWIENKSRSVDVMDTVGSGDAFLAGLINGLLNGTALKETLSFANATGAFVATQDGATPVLDIEKIKELQT